MQIPLFSIILLCQIYVSQGQIIIVRLQKDPNFNKRPLLSSLKPFTFWVLHKESCFSFHSYKTIFNLRWIGLWRSQFKSKALSYCTELNVENIICMMQSFICFFHSFYTSSHYYTIHSKPSFKSMKTSLNRLFSRLNDLNSFLLETIKEQWTDDAIIYKIKATLSISHISYTLTISCRINTAL